MQKPKIAKTHRSYLNREFVLKLLGGGILLTSFVTQNVFYDEWNAQSQESHAAAVDESLIDKSVLLNEALFYTSRADDSIDPNELRNMRQYYIREAARKTALAKTVWILASGLDSQKKLELTNGLMTHANGVKDLASFSELNRSVNEIDGRYGNAIRENLNAVEGKRKSSRTIYLLLYGLGALMVASSLWFERKRILLEAELA
jgi:hypothetical protein